MRLSRFEVSLVEVSLVELRRKAGRIYDHRLGVRSRGYEDGADAAGAFLGGDPVMGDDGL
jgi:hypothetical protein